MKKVIGLCLVVLLSSVSAFAREGRHMDRKAGDPSKRCEKMIQELKLDDKQAAEFRKINEEFRQKMKAEREVAKADREKKRAGMLAMRNDRDAQLKKVLTEEQYKLYQEKQTDQQQKSKRHYKGNGRK
ncbi:hypothetical protein [Parabacteroides bouchesdurhonensis]|uniref:hypothetical protein n=1 Tax=Parabacteroides bouchesdurhonensis TaxID=1936995 RepID=UPI000C82C585|nr:hypothetical protein [Parabacteroides bouchesdurhonensis]